MIRLFGARTAVWRPGLTDRPWLWLAPSTVLLVMFTIYPFFYNIYLSLHEFNMFRRTLSFVGLENWQKMFFEDTRFWRAVFVTFVYTAGCLTVQVVLGLSIALLIDAEGRNFSLIRSILLLPLVVPPAVTGMMFLMMEDSQFGLISHWLMMFGIVSPESPLLTGQHTALVAVMLADVWQWTPFMVLIMLAGLRTLPQEPFEAAVLEKARFHHILFHLTLPMLRPVLAVAVLIRGIDLFRTFDYVFVMTSGGPGVATQTLSYYTWKQSFAFIKWGYSATLSLFSVIVLIMVVMLFVKWAKLRW